MSKWTAQLKQKFTAMKKKLLRPKLVTMGSPPCKKRLNIPLPYLPLLKRVVAVLDHLLFARLRVPWEVVLFRRVYWLLNG